MLVHPWIPFTRVRTYTYTYYYVVLYLLGLDQELRSCTADDLPKNYHLKNPHPNTCYDTFGGVVTW